MASGKLPFDKNSLKKFLTANRWTWPSFPFLCGILFIEMEGLVRKLMVYSMFFLFMILTIVAAHRLLKDTKRKLYDSDYCSENAIFTNIVCHCVKSRTLHAKTFNAALSRSNCFGIALLIATCPERLLDNSTRWNLSGASADVSYLNSISCEKIFWDTFNCVKLG